MRFISILLFCLSTTFGFAQEEEQKQLKIVESICAASHAESSSKKKISDLSGDELTPMSLTLDAQQNFGLKAKALRFETYAVRIDFFDGYRFHVADYYDGTCIVTCLDGPLVGYQVISVNGTVTADSSNVIWRKDHFVHRYLNGKVLTYERMQAIELK